MCTGVGIHLSRITHATMRTPPHPSGGQRRPGRRRRRPQGRRPAPRRRRRPAPQSGPAGAPGTLPGAAGPPLRPPPGAGPGRAAPLSATAAGPDGRESDCPATRGTDPRECSAQGRTSWGCSFGPAGAACMVLPVVVPARFKPGHLASMRPTWPGGASFFVSKSKPIFLYLALEIAGKYLCLG